MKPGNLEYFPRLNPVTIARGDESGDIALQLIHEPDGESLRDIGMLALLRGRRN